MSAHHKHVKLSSFQAEQAARFAAQRRTGSRVVSFEEAKKRLLRRRARRLKPARTEGEIAFLWFCREMDSP